MKTKLLTFTLTLLVLSIVALPTMADGLGSLVNQEFDIVQDGVTGSTTSPDPDVIIVNIIEIILSFLGLLFVILILWSGFQWMTAGGNTEAITKAKQRIINSIIGLAIILAAYSITQFVITEIYDATKG